MPGTVWTGFSGATDRRVARGSIAPFPVEFYGFLQPYGYFRSNCDHISAGSIAEWIDGVPAATLSGGETRFFEELDPATEWFARKAPMRGTRRALPLGTEVYDREG